MDNQTHLCDTLLKHDAHRLHNPRMNVAQFPQSERIFGMLDAIELIRRSLVD